LSEVLPEINEKDPSLSTPSPVKPVKGKQSREIQI